MESRQLRYFVTVARERNFTRAAEKLNIAQPPLSRQILALEEEFGVTLIDRTKRPLVLTDAGRLLFEQSVHLLDQMEGLKSMLRQMVELERQHFSIGFVASTLYGFLPEVIRRYRTMRPNVELTLLELTTMEQLAALKEGRIDVGFGRLRISDAQINRVLLRNERLSVAVPSQHPLAARGQPVRIADIADEPLIAYPKAPRPSFADQVLELYRERNLRPSQVIEVRELQIALGLVAAESGICIVPGSLVHLRRENVVYLPLDEAGAVSPVIMSTRKGDRSSEIGLILRLVKDLYRHRKITFGA